MAPTGEICFECKATGGRMVRLYKQTYYGHIRRNHPEIARDYDYPVKEIEKALTDAVRGPEQANSRKTEIYWGPIVTPKTNPGPERFKVVVHRETATTGWVVTAYQLRE